MLARAHFATRATAADRGAPPGCWQGYIFGGVVAGPLGWRAAFLLEAAAMAPFCAFCALAPAIALRGMQPENGELPCACSQGDPGGSPDLLQELRRPHINLTCLGLPSQRSCGTTSRGRPCRDGGRRRRQGGAEDVRRGRGRAGEGGGR